MRRTLFQPSGDSKRQRIHLRTILSRASFIIHSAASFSRELLTQKTQPRSCLHLRVISGNIQSWRLFYEYSQEFLCIHQAHCARFGGGVAAADSEVTLLRSFLLCPTPTVRGADSGFEHFCHQKLVCVFEEGNVASVSRGNCDEPF